VKKKAPAHVKKEVKDKLAPEEDERPWWVKEMMMADAAHHPNDPANEPGLHLLQAQSI
jgi:hypothetical protein